MIKLKKILFEEYKTLDDYANVEFTTTSFQLRSGNDPYVYYWDAAEKMWYTKQKTQSKWINMKSGLINRFGELEGLSRYEQADTLLRDWFADFIKQHQPENNVIKDDTNDITVILDKVPNIDTVEVNKIFAKDLNLPVSDVVFDDKWIKASEKRNREVIVTGKTPDSTYLKVILPNRGLRHNVETWVNASDFDVKSTDDGKTFTGTYIGNGSRFELYKPKEKEKED